MRYPASVGAAALAAGLLATAANAQVVDFSKYPDFKGQWDRTGPPNNWRQLSGPPPLTPEYQKVYNWSLSEQRWPAGPAIGRRPSACRGQGTCWR